jgi:protein required for attachment to host cells
MSPMPSVDWVLVADRSRASLLHALPNGLRPWPTLAGFVHEEARLTPQERDTAAPGRVMHPGGARSAVEPHEDRSHVEARRFAAQITEHLDRERLNRRFDRLVVVAPPMFLGVLREASSAPLRAMTAIEFDRDLIPLPEAELQQRLFTIVASLPA